MDNRDNFLENEFLLAYIHLYVINYLGELSRFDDKTFRFWGNIFVAICFLSHKFSTYGACLRIETIEHFKVFS